MGQFGFRLIGEVPNTSLRNKTNNAMEMIAIHHGLSTIGNKTTSNHAHQGIRDQRSVPDFVGFARLTMRREDTAGLSLDSRNFNLTYPETPRFCLSAKLRDSRLPLAAGGVRSQNRLFEASLEDQADWVGPGGPDGWIC